MITIEDELEDSLDEIEPESGSIELYEHFRVIADKGRSIITVTISNGLTL